MRGSPPLLLLLLVFLAMAPHFSCAQKALEQPRSPPASATTTLTLLHSCKNAPPISLCSLQQQRHPPLLRHLPSPPSIPREDDGSDFDPRYGVQKRLVPGGPNPLHN